MSMSTSMFMTAYGVTADTQQQDKLDCSDVLSAILLKDTAILGQIPLKGVVNNTETSWFEDSLNACTFSGAMFSLTESTQSAIGYLTVAAAFTAARMNRIIRPGAILRQESINTLFQVGAYTQAAATISITVYSSLTLCASAYPTTSIWVDSSASTALHSRWFVVGMPKGDISVYSDDISQGRVRRLNYTQVFERGIQITQTREGISLYAVPDELKHQIKLRTYEIKRELNNAVINSAAYVTGGAFTGDFDMRTMSGIIQQIRDGDLDGTNEDATVSSAAGGALTITRINDLCKQMYDLGGFDDQSNCCIVTSPYQARIIALLEEGRIRRASNELVVGSYANKVKTDLGFDLDVIIDRWCPGPVLIILDRNRAELKSLAGDSWALVKMAKTGRYQGYQLSGQYTVILRNADVAHGLIHNLAFG